MSNTKKKQLDVAIIGAGVSGLYAGWRLKTAKATRKKKVSIFEMSNRIGGRLFTLQNFAGTGMNAELGGMRYLTHQRMVYKLIEHLELETIDFPMGKEEDPLYYLRRSRFRESEWGKNFATPYYNVSKYGRDENCRLLDADEIFEKIVKDVLTADVNKKVLKENGIEDNQPKNREEWDRIKSKLICPFGADKGLHLEDVGFWNLVQEMADAECYEIVAQAGAYYSNTINWNAAEALPYVTGDFTGDTKYKTLKKGFDQLAHELHKEFVKAKGNVKMEHQLLRFEINPDNKYRYSLIFLVEGEEITYEAKQIIFGLPRRALELIDWPEKLNKNTRFKKNVRSVIGDPAFKLLMAFDHPEEEKPWWEQAFGLTSGRSVTDLPMRQCYYFGTENKKSILLATYNDMRTVSFWKTLENPHAKLQEFWPPKGGLSRAIDAAKKTSNKEADELFQPDLKVLGKLGPRSAEEQVPQALKRMVDHALSQLKELHGLEDIPTPYFTAYMNWNHDPYGGGYHAWKARFEIGKVMKAMRKPLSSESIHVVGEAYSDQQGWVEGAFCITELMLEENFGLKRPKWLDKDYYLGR